MRRRVVTGVDSAGRSLVASDSLVAPTEFEAFPGNAHYDIWGADGRYTVPNDGRKPEYELNHPLPGGFRVIVFRFAPESMRMSNPAEVSELKTEMRKKIPAGSQQVVDDDLMETTPSVDIGIVLSGEITLVLDDGAETVLKEGDFVVQNGTRHTWRNKSEDYAQVMFILIDAHVVDPRAGGSASS